MLKKYLKINKYGFTLAEILVVITIVGVIASLTIPSLISKIQNNQRIAQFKKLYSTLSEAGLQVKEDMGGRIENPWDITGFNWATGDPRYINSFKKYLNYITICMPGNSCWKSIGKNGNFSDLSNTYYGDCSFMIGCKKCDGSLTLADGVTIFFDDESGLSYIGDYAIGIIADLNGIKSPNVVGKDIFFFGLYANGMVTFIQGNPAWDNIPCNTANDGYTCGKAIMSNNYNLN